MKTFVILWTITLFVKIVCAYFFPLATDEAYYWVWGQNLHLSYFDHPPFISYLTLIGDLFSFGGNSFRWPSIVLNHISIFIWFKIWIALFGNDSRHFQKYLFWFLLVLTSPVLGIGSIFVTPDLPLLFFWSLSFYFFIKVIRTASSKYYFYLGISLGLGFSSKYQIVLFVLSSIIYLLATKKLKFLISQKTLLTLFGGLFFCLPVLIWNYQNDFASFKFQIKHGFERPDYQFYWTWSYILGQILTVSPIVWIFAFKNKLNESTKLLWVFAAVPMLFFLYSSFSAVVELNWPIVAYASIFALSSQTMENFKPIKIILIYWVTIIILAFSIALLKQGSDPNLKLNEYKELSSLIEKTTHLKPLYLSSYQMASVFYYETRSPHYKLNGLNRKDFYDFLENSIPKIFPFFVLCNSETNLPEWIEKSEIYKTSIVETLPNGYRVFRVDK